MQFRVDIFRSIECLKDKIVVPPFQRLEDKDRVGYIKTYIAERRKSGKTPCLGTIDLCSFNEKYYVIDGQHRISALFKDFEESKICVPFAVIIYDVNSLDEMKDIFQTRNMGIPVPEYILTAKDDRKILIDECHKFLLPVALFVSAHRCNRPSISIPSFMQHLTTTVHWKSITCLDQFISLLDNLNRRVRDFYTPESSWKQGGVTEPMWKKAEKNGIYIGLDKWYGFNI